MAHATQFDYRQLFVSYHVHLQLTTHRVCDITTHPFESGLESAKQKIVVGFSLKSLSILARNIPAHGKSIARILRKSTPRDTIRSTITCGLSSLLYLTDNNSKLFFLLDSGAYISVLPCREIGNKHKSDTFRLTAANGSEINTNGERFLLIDFGFEKQLPWIFIVADVKDPFIGVDFLRHHDISI